MDRNQIIVVLHNLSCCYQRLVHLEDCVSYLDGTIYNIDSKITNFDEACDEMILLHADNENQEDESTNLNEEVT